MLKDLCIEIIEKCPNNCMFCSSCSNIDKEKIISFRDYKRIIDYFYYNYGIEELSISGGEPFLHPDLFEMIEYSKSLGIKTVLFTSGIKIRIACSKEEREYLLKERDMKINQVLEHEPWNKRLINNIKNSYNQYIYPDIYSSISNEDIEELEKRKLDKIVFDMQTYGEEDDSRLMGRRKKSYDYLLSSIIKASKSKINVDVHFVPMKPNYKTLPDIIELLNIVDVNYLSILKFVPQGRGKINQEKLLLTEEEMKDFFIILEECKKMYKGNIRTSIPLDNNFIHKCNAGLNKLDIKFDGTILPCAALKELTEEEIKQHNIKLYNIYETSENVKIYDGVRDNPLCKRLYKN